jgi:dsDNA-specific endonuclease/ATPase MutS2
MPKRPGPGPDDIDADLLEAGTDPDADPSAEAPDASPDASVAPPLTHELDLHTFQPRDCADVVAEYLRAAQDAGLASVRIVHGKGTGTLRRIVHGVLDRHPAVRAYRLADERSGSWGATLVELHPRAP